MPTVLKENLFPISMHVAFSCYGCYELCHHFAYGVMELDFCLEDMILMQHGFNETAILLCIFLLFFIVLMLMSFLLKNSNLDAQGCGGQSRIYIVDISYDLDKSLGMRCSGSLRI